MITADDLLKEISDLEREIDALRDRRHELELGLRYARGGGRLLRGLFVLMTIRDLERQIYDLRLRYGATYNGYLLLRRGEAGRATATPPSPVGGSRRSPRETTPRRDSR